MKSRELMRQFERAGWTLARVRGGHYIYQKSGHTFPVPHHSGDLSPGVVRAALKLIEEVG